MNPHQQELLPLLKQYFGFTSFRPLQKEIIDDVLAGKDVFALLPTGGGKSLCFQLPSLVRPGLTLVISPLISLMKDQVDAMQAGGVAATLLNSSLAAGESRKRTRELHEGAYRLLYVAPERALMPAFLNEIKNWNINLIAIDEAHCVSEWGHDFRPEYRQLVELRKHLPEVPIMALTATATTRVREDIVKHLQLRNPRCYVASFNRPNLNYKVMPKSDPYSQVLAFVRARPNESGIIYCQSRKTCESVAGQLREDGISAAPYHAGLEAVERTRNQELFLRDDVRVICATIAFGMGINKPNVRFVLHYDLPKNIEGYYQETGRAGRDGLPAECVLLFSAGDMMKQLFFIEEKTDPQEQRIAKAQLEEMVHYAERAECRRALLLEYFGERYAEPNCNGCDNCLAPREMYDATVVAQKFLSCVYRIKDMSGFNVGLNHVVEVLTGADTEKVRKWNHNQLSTYGIGKEMSRTEWLSVGRQLIRLRYVQQNHEKFNVLELTDEGLRVVKERVAVHLSKPQVVAEPMKHGVGEIACDEQLFERLRELRKRLADERNVAAYIVFSDVSLRQMARNYPTKPDEFVRISGVGEKKLNEFGGLFMSEIERYLQTNPRRKFSNEPSQSPSTPKPKRLNETTKESLKLFYSGKSIEEIARLRTLATSTIESHLLAAVNAGEELQINQIIPSDVHEEIAAAFAKLGFSNLTGVYELLGGKFSYGVLRLFRAIKQPQKALPSTIQINSP